MSTSTLFRKVRVKRVLGSSERQVDNITTDSRTAREGSIFVASVEYTVDSRKFCQNVADRGCKLVTVNKEQSLPANVAQVVVPDTLKVASTLAHTLYDYPSHQLMTFGVAGTNGKTSTATMIHLVQRKLQRNSAYLGTNGFQINETKTKGANTIPETVSLTKKIREAVNAGAKSMTSEVSSHGLVLGRLRGVEFDVAIFSNLAQDHLDFHSTMEAHGHVKPLLFSQLGEDLSKEKYVVLNNDDSFSEYLRTVMPYEVFSYGIDEEAQFMAKSIQGSLQGVSLDFVTPFRTYPVKSSYVGKFNISNIMAAMIAVWSKGTFLEAIIRAVKNLESVERRLEILDPSLPIDSIIDYAHTTDGMNKLIDAVRPFVKQKLIFLAGVAGERGSAKTPEIGRVTCRADHVIFTSDNPANDDPKMLTAELAKGATHQDHIESDDRAEETKHAIDIAEPGDTVVLASKGREPCQIMPGHIKVLHRDDLIGLKAAYKKFGGSPVD